jgi:hypothetical protein
MDPLYSNNDIEYADSFIYERDEYINFLYLPSFLYAWTLLWWQLWQQKHGTNVSSHSYCYFMCDVQSKLSIKILQLSLLHTHIKK